MGNLEHAPQGEATPLESHPQQGEAITKKTQDSVQLDEKYTVHPHEHITEEEQNIIKEKLAVLEHTSDNAQQVNEAQVQQEQTPAETQHEGDTFDTSVDKVREVTGNPIATIVLKKANLLEPLNGLFALANIKKIFEDKKKTPGEKTEEVVGEVVGAAVPFVGSIAYKTVVGTLKGLLSSAPKNKGEEQIKTNPEIPVPAN